MNSTSFIIKRHTINLQIQRCAHCGATVNLVQRTFYVGGIGNMTITECKDKCLMEGK
jgi:recombinational DNA repair protein (RecF pathway)